MNSFNADSSGCFTRELIDDIIELYHRVQALEYIRCISGASEPRCSSGVDIVDMHHVIQEYSEIVKEWSGGESGIAL